MAGKFSDAQSIWLNNSGQQNSPDFSLSALQLATSNPDKLMKEFLLPHFKRLCREPQSSVRQHVAAVFHEFAQSLKSDVPLLIDSFIDLTRSGDPAVISCLANHLEQILECIYGEKGLDAIEEKNGCTSQISKFHPAHTRLVRTLLACNLLIRDGSQWRCHEQLLTSYSCLSRFLPNDELCQTFLPMIKNEVLTARALPCRLAALRTLIKWTKEIKSPKDVQSIIEFCKENLATHKSCHKRILFLDACGMSMEYISKQFFKQNFFTLAIKLVHDPVLNVRLKLCKSLPLFKSALTPSCDGDKLMAVEACVKKLMVHDNHGHMGEILKKIINEMAHADSVNNVISSSQARNFNLPPRPKSEIIYSTTPITKNGPTPQAARTFPSVLRAMSAWKDAFSGQKENATDIHSSSQLSNGTADYSFGTQNGYSKPPNKIIIDLKSAPTKKVAVIYPQRPLNRPPSPLPSIHPSELCQCDKEAAEKSIDQQSIDQVYSTPSRIPISDTNGHPKSSTIDSKFRRIWSKLPPSSKEAIETENHNTERIVPIKFVPLNSTPLSWDNSNQYWESMRPSTPAAFRRLSASSASLPRSTTLTGGHVRNIPVVRTGLVMRSVEKLENSNGK